MGEDTALTPLEVSEILKISKNTVYELIKRGELNAYRVGKKVRVDMSDVEEYKNRTKSRGKSAAPKVSSSIGEHSASLITPKISPAAPEEVQKGTGFVICGQDIMLDILSRYLEAHPNGVQALRAYIGSYNGLYSLYHGNVSIATAHLWDGENDEYNVPYVKRMLPGVPAVLVNLAYRNQGFYVAKGNPKNIKGWQDLKRDDIVIVNREKGSGTRILLDEHLKKMKISPWSLKGYERECSSHLAVASAVARGGADAGLGNEKYGLQVKGVDFIPLKSERYDLIIKKEDLNKVQFQAVLEIINSEEFKLELEGIGGYDLGDIGKIMAET
jgi:putative molybdopterin biosynthesis protein